MDWKTKAAIFRGLAGLPFEGELLYALQRLVTRQWPRPSEDLDALLRAARRLQAAQLQGRLLEIGAGRDLAVALALRMLGAEHVTCVDVTRLARLPLIRHAANHMAERLGRTAPVFEDWRAVESFGIRYIAPATLQDAPLVDSSLDGFYSVDTLEHIPRPDLPDVLRRARQLLKPHSLAIHLVDYSDHYARGSGISRFNFLTYDDEKWRPFNTRLHFVNRLRHSEMLACFRSAHFVIVTDELDVSTPEVDILRRLAPQFRGFAVDDLFTLRALIAARSD